MGNNLPTGEHQYAHYIGEKRPGETRVLRNIHFAEGDQLTSNLRGMTDLKTIFETNAKSHPNKPFLGTRERLPDQTFGAYQWKTYQEVN